MKLENRLIKGVVIGATLATGLILGGCAKGYNPFITEKNLENFGDKYELLDMETPWYENPLITGKEPVDVKQVNYTGNPNPFE